MKKLHVQYGCGLSAPKEWVNFDVSPTLRLQNLPVLGLLFRRNASTRFPSNVRYGDIIKGLPVSDNSCDGLYSSHTLEHISLEDFRIALRNSYRILKKEGIFRCVVPDLELMARSYINDLDNGNPEASVTFVENTLMGQKTRAKGAKGMLKSYLGNFHHLWMWDANSLATELKNAGFASIRNCAFNDSEDKMFLHVEDESRFASAVAIECRK